MNNLHASFRLFIFVFFFFSFGLLKTTGQNEPSLHLSWEKIIAEDEFINVIGIIGQDFYGYSPQGLYKSLDNGENWIQIASSRGISGARIERGKVIYTYDRYGSAHNPLGRRQVGISIYNPIGQSKGHHLVDGTYNGYTIVSSVLLSDDAFGYTVSSHSWGTTTRYFYYTVPGATEWDRFMLSEDNYYTAPTTYFKGKLLTLIYDFGTPVLTAFSPDTPENIDTIAHYSGEFIATDSMLYILQPHNDRIITTNDLVNFVEHEVSLPDYSKYFIDDNRLFCWHGGSLLVTQDFLSGEFEQVFSQADISPYQITNLSVSGNNFFGKLNDSIMVHSNDGSITWEIDTVNRPFGSNIGIPAISGNTIYSSNRILSESGLFINTSQEKIDSLKNNRLYKKDNYWVKSRINPDNKNIIIENSTDEGLTWTPIFIDTLTNHSYYLRHFKFIFGEKIYAYNRHYILVSTDETASWQILNETNAENLIIKGDTLIACDGTELTRSVNGGESWTTILDDTKNFHLHDDILLAFRPGYSYGSIDRSFDYGNTWQYYKPLQPDYLHNWRYDDKDKYIAFKTHNWSAYNYLSVDYGENYYKIGGPFSLVGGDGWHIQYLVSSATFTFIGDYLYATGINGTWRTKIFPSLFDEEATICEGENYDFGDSTYTTSGIHIDHFGQDSTAQLHLTVLPLHEEVDYEVPCGFIYQDNVLIHDTTFTDTHISPQGCELTITYNLTIATESYPDSEINEELCHGEVYELGGNTYDHSGTYHIVFENSIGCDSTVILDLTVLSRIRTQFFINIEYGTLHDGIPIYNDTLISETYIAQSGCDSLVETYLTVVTDINDMSKVFSNLSVQPNPSTNIFHLNFSLKSSTDLTVEIYDLLGRRIQTLTKDKKYLLEKHQLEIDARAWKPGTYFINLKTRDGNRTVRIVKI